MRTSSLRGLGAWANVFAIESFMDELAEIAGDDPVTYRLSLLSDPRPRRVVETAARMSGWFEPRDLPEGRALRLRLCPLQEHRLVRRRGGRGRGRRGGPAQAHLVRGRRGPRASRPTARKNQLEGGIIQGASFVMREQVRFEDGRVGDPTWDDYPILRFSDIPEIEIELIDNPNEPTWASAKRSVGPTGAAIGNAVARALGKRIRDLPLTRERIMATLLAE